MIHTSRLCYITREMSADDVFVFFVETARRMLYESFQKELQEDTQINQPSWSWVCSRLLSCCKAYPGGVTSAILLSDLYESWLERVRIERCVRFTGRSGSDSRNNDGYQLRKQKQPLGTKVTSIDSILESKFVAMDAVLDVVILDVQILPGTTTCLLTLGDAWSFNTIEMYLHSKFYDLVDDKEGLLKKAREIRLTGCRLNNAPNWGSVPPRLLPTELLVVVLDDEQEEDIVLLGAKFCNDYFSSIQLSNIKAGTDFFFYARVEEIEVTGLQGQTEQIKHRRITLRDDNGDALPFFLWNDQVSLSDLLSKGSMVAIERPWIVCELESDNCTVSGLGFEYKGNTRLYTVPYAPVGEQAPGDENQLQPNTTESLEKGQRVLVESVRSKMTNLTLYGLVTHLSRTPDLDNSVKHNLGTYNCAYVMRIGDTTGVLDINLHFNDQWSAGEIHVGQIVFISGIVTSIGSNGVLECTWTEKHGVVTLVNMTQLPALLSTSCLHRVVPLSKVSSSTLTVQVCRVRTGSLVQHGVQVKYCHTCCGRPVIGQAVPNIWMCNFCRQNCDIKDTVLTFFLTALLLDTYPGQKTQLYATCSGQAAREILQADPEDFCSLSEIDQGMYLYGLENEQFLVTLYSGLQDEMSTFQTGGSNPGNALTCLRIGQALKVKPDRSDN
ncbi:unnamed protein product [Calypogeia fissa]